MAAFFLCLFSSSENISHCSVGPKWTCRFDSRAGLSVNVPSTSWLLFTGHLPDSAPLEHCLPKRRVIWDPPACTDLVVPSTHTHTHTHTGLMIDWLLRMSSSRIAFFFSSRLVFSLNLTFTFESLSWLLHQMILWFYRWSPSDAKWDQHSPRC